MTARTGRAKQVYTADGERIVGGTIPIDDKGRILLISSSSHKDRWVLPKGGHECDETIEETAIRESWEEAGVTGQIIKELPVTKKAHSKFVAKTIGTQALVSELHFFVFKVISIDDKWPESNRKRKWVKAKEAIKLLSSRPELSTLVEYVVSDSTIQLDRE
ncbi:hypothetical protein CANCADRAFT_25156 [Tortispora caseinolytica NRRL Y-17796]|uniref:Nudix hydrolase domain-containing protein n=1 Tax=Tortispora caseinolytica NRRL Y-17796 TaxID=767744 RepID=A0A1E4TEA8_9ASCO|nr:hypothetical protein CANCADRAFT_25156 [Tortispora caseinolytica NRRL Y-17796]